MILLLKRLLENVSLKIYLCFRDQVFATASKPSFKDIKTKLNNSLKEGIALNTSYLFGAA